MTIRALWKEIDAWFETHQATKNLEARRRAASAKQLAAVTKKVGTLPAELRESLAIHNGGGNFGSYELFGTAEIARTWASMTKRHEAGDLAKRLWNRAWIPFAQDGGGNLRALDPVKQRLLAIELQGPQGVFATRRRTFKDFLAAYADKLRTGEYVVDDEGFVDEPQPSREVHPDEVGKELDSLVSNAVFADDVATIRKLLDAGTIQPNSRTAFQVPILATAARHERREVLALLLERGADVNIDAGFGDRNPLIACCYSNTPHLAIIEILLDAGADPSTKDHLERGGDAVSVATMYRQPALVALLEARARKTTKPRKPTRRR